MIVPEELSTSFNALKVPVTIELKGFYRDYSALDFLNFAQTFDPSCDIQEWTAAVNALPNRTQKPLVLGIEWWKMLYIEKANEAETDAAAGP